MIVYNITTKLTHGISADWLRWQQEEHSPAILATGLFTDFKIFHLLDQEETDGPTYTIQYFSPSLGQYQEYILHFATGFRKEAFDKWGDRFIAFRTLMELVN